MADNELKTRLLSAFNTTAYWATATKIPLAGEVCYCVSDDSKHQIIDIKIGNGVHKYSELPSVKVHEYKFDEVGDTYAPSYVPSNNGGEIFIPLVETNIAAGTSAATSTANIILPVATTGAAGYAGLMSKNDKTKLNTLNISDVTYDTSNRNLVIDRYSGDDTTVTFGTMAFKSSSDYIPTGERTTSISSPASSSKKVPTDYAVVQYLENSVKPMRYMGTVDMTATPAVNLPTSNIRIGDTYKVAGNGSYGPTGNTTVAKVGDLFIAKTTASWDYIPSADDDPGVVSVGADGTYLSTSGQASAVIINHKEQSNVTTGTYGGATSVAQIIVDKAGHATSVKNVAIQTATTAQKGLIPKLYINDDTKISIDNTNMKINHATAFASSGSMTAGTAGTADGWGESISFTVPEFNYDKTGHLTSTGSKAFKVAIPGNPNTDIAVKQKNITGTTAAPTTAWLIGAPDTTDGTASTVWKTPKAYLLASTSVDENGRQTTVHADYFSGTAANAELADRAVTADDAMQAVNALTLQGNDLKTTVALGAAGGTGASSVTTKIYAVQPDSAKDLAVYVPWTDTHVTTVVNHYTPTSSGTFGATASGADPAWSIDVVKGVTLQKDAAGHITGISVDSGKIPSSPSIPVTAVIGDNTWTTVASVDNANKFKVSHIGPGSVTNTYGASVAQTPTFGGSFSIPYIKSDGKGHVTTSSSTASVKIPSSVASWDYYTTGVTTTTSGETIQVKFNRTDGTNKYNFTIPEGNESTPGISSTVSTDRLRNGTKVLILNGNFTV